MPRDASRDAGVPGGIPTCASPRLFQGGPRSGLPRGHRKRSGPAPSAGPSRGARPQFRRHTPLSVHGVQVASPLRSSQRRPRRDAPAVEACSSALRLQPQTDPRSSCRPGHNPGHSERSELSGVGAGIPRWGARKAACPRGWTNSQMPEETGLEPRNAAPPRGISSRCSGAFSLSSGPRRTFKRLPGAGTRPRHRRMYGADDGRRR